MVPRLTVAMTTPHSTGVPSSECFPFLLLKFVFFADGLHALCVLLCSAAAADATLALGAAVGGPACQTTLWTFLFHKGTVFFPKTMKE